VQIARVILGAKKGDGISAAFDDDALYDYDAWRSDYAELWPEESARGS
jgi:hypothetical protein